ncbi:PD-(D/E)XK motif protein [Pedobacter endophyticus]|uniref:PD-(D/E)XK motif protein n=1 Tax=Pedobacter endophyticus TaxID=2789740 RepID=A0A7U3SNZ1_9SPHI|nr:PD-(D/E)XK motif protein [Pedobacter endophyticus]QPH37868.1 PD-(D/E)XK motif protein [Pedobacter endophyticus]
MRTEQLEQQWLKISADVPENGLNSIRISSSCIPELYLGIDRDGDRNLILSVPKDFKLSFRTIVKENLSIDFFADSHHIVLKLIHQPFSDLFNDLILSLYSKIEKMSTPGEYIQEFIKAFHRWNGFFSGRSSQTLSDEVVKGLFGEMIVLRHELEGSETILTNKILESWKGPYDATHDFENDLNCTEVKTMEYTKTKVRISSEFQLENVPDKTLRLCVVSLRNDDQNGKTISDLIISVRERIYQHGGDLSIFITALSRKGFFGSVQNKYDHLKFTPLRMTLYDCVGELFPKLTPKNLDEGISEVMYSILLSKLEPYKISEHALAWK